MYVIPVARIFCGLFVFVMVTPGLALADICIYLLEIRRWRVIDGQAVLSESIWLPEPQFYKLLDVAPADLPDILYPL